MLIAGEIGSNLTMNGNEMKCGNVLARANESNHIDSFDTKETD